MSVVLSAPLYSLYYCLQYLCRTIAALNCIIITTSGPVCFSYHNLHCTVTLPVNGMLISGLSKVYEHSSKGTPTLAGRRSTLETASPPSHIYLTSLPETSTLFMLFKLWLSVTSWSRPSTATISIYQQFSPVIVKLCLTIACFCILGWHCYCSCWLSCPTLLMPSFLFVSHSVCWCSMC